VKEMPSKEKPELQPCSSRIQLSRVSLVLCGLSQAGERNLGVSASGLMAISRQPDGI
jgi:hypothetical protein